MKKVIFSLALLLTSSILGFAQKGISYQAIILDPKPIEIPGQDITGQPFVNGDVSLKFKLFSSTFVQEFEEVHTTKTDAYGMINVLIGSQNTGAFSALVWDINPRSMQVWVSFDQGGTYTKVSEQVLTYTPYALYAETTGTAGKLSGTLTISEGGTGAKTAANARTNLGLGNVDNTSDANKPMSIAAQQALDAKANDLTTYVNNQITAAAIPDADGSTKGKIQLAGDLAGTAAAPTVPGLLLKANSVDVNDALALKADAAAVTSALNLKANATEMNDALALKADAAAVNAALNLKANAVDVTNELALKANAAETRTLLREKELIDNKSINVLTDASSDTKYPTVKSIKTYVDAQVAGATIADANASTKGKIQLAGDLAGTAAAPTVPGLALKADAAAVATSLGLKEDVSNKANTPLGTSTTLYPTQNAVKTYVDTQVAGATIADADGSTKGKIQLAGDLGGTAAAPTVPGLALKAPLASPTFTGTVTTDAITTGALSSSSVTAPTYASTPRTLTYSGSTISWNPTQGLNAEITLTQNSTLSFTAAPPVGSYGTVVLTQDATGNRTITLPTITNVTNKVLGSTSTSTVALSTAASSKDILNFYYDGTVVYWNIGQGYGSAATSASTNLASSVSGTLAVANGGTGATTLTGLVKGSGTSALTAAVAGTDYQAPLTLTTTGSGAASLSGTTLNIPSTSNYALPTASASTLGGVKVGTNLSIDGSGVLSADLSGGSITGTVAVANGGTGQTTLTGVKNTLGLLSSKVAIGADAGLTNQGNDAIAIGYNAGLNNQGASSIAIGYLAGGTATQGGSSIAIGPISGGGGNNSVAIGLAAWTGANNATAVGTLAAAGHVNSAALGYQAVTTSPNTIQLGADGVTVSGSTAITNVITSGSLTAGAVTYPNTNGTAGQVLTANNNGNASWTTIASVADASTMTGTVAVGKGGTGATTLTGYVKGTGTTAMTASATIPVADVTGAAPLASPALTGTPTAPTASSGTNNTQVATTEFVTSALSSSGLPSQSGNNGKFLTTNGSTASWASSAGVPYSGASGAVNLGDYNLTVRGIKIGTSGTDNFALQNNMVIGRDALESNTNGYLNIAIGNTALYYNTSGYANIAIGSESQGLNSSGNYNTSVGQAALYKNTGSYNTAIGSQAGYFLNSSGNTAVGFNALDGQGDGGGNTGIGYNAGAVSWDNRTYNSTFLGYNAKSQNGQNNVIVIGYNAYTNEDHTIQLGDNRILKLKTYGTIWSNGTQLTSDLRLKTNIQPIPNSLEFIMKLNPVHYTKKNSIESTDYSKTENGFIAQELQKVLPYLVIEGTDKDKILSVDYNSIIPVLTKGIQEQQLLINAQQKQIDEMKLILESLMKEKK